ncbi:MAG: queuosine precursor transporter [Pseudomonadota bacterium]
MSQSLSAPSRSALIAFILAMAVVVVCSNVLVNFPVMVEVGSVNLGDLLTWGAFTYPAAFLITDLTNRRFGPSKARRVVFVGFALAVVCSIIVPQLLFNMGLFPFEMSTSRLARIAVASGTAFLLAQLLDVLIFDRLRRGEWWKPPLVSSLIGSTLDTVLFFTIAFAAGFVFLGENDGFALENAPFLAISATEAPRWMSWAIGDLGVKILMGLVMLIPYSVLRNVIAPKDAVAA